MLVIPFYGFTQSQDSVTISKEFYNIIATCPVYLNECEELRKLDSLLLVVKDAEINNLVYNNVKLKQEKVILENNVKKLRWNVVKFSVVSFAVGFITTIFVLH